jgi:hypothetical protein
MPDKFKTGQRVYSAKEMQYGVVTSPRARLRTSDFEPRLNPPRDAKAIPSYDVRFDNNLQGTYLETELESAMHHRCLTVPSAWAKEHNVALTLLLGVIVAIATAVTAVASVVSLYQKH